MFLFECWGDCIFVNTQGKIGFSLVPFPSNQSLIILQHMFLFQPHWSIHCLYMYIANNILYPLSFAALPYLCPVYTGQLSLQRQTQVPTPVGNYSHLPKDLKKKKISKLQWERAKRYEILQATEDSREKQYIKNAHEI